MDDILTPEQVAFILDQIRAAARAYDYDDDKLVSFYANLLLLRASHEDLREQLREANAEASRIEMITRNQDTHIRRLTDALRGCKKDCLHRSAPDACRAMGLLAEMEEE